MERLTPLGQVRRTFQTRLDQVLGQRFFHDRLSVGVLSAALIVNGLSLVALALRLKSSDVQVAVHFSSFTLFDRLGPWYYPFEIALAATAVTVVNGAFAYHSFTRSRLASFFLLVAALVVAVFAFVIAQAFGAVR